MMAKTEVSDSAEVRPVRVCDVCGGVDDHPRHVHGVGPDEAAVPSAEVVGKVMANLEGSYKDSTGPVMADLFDRTTQTRHIDCCREAGCPDGSCNSRPDVRGMELLAAIQKESK